jgi:hypothetical protein
MKALHSKKEMVCGDAPANHSSQKVSIWYIKYIYSIK